MNKVILIGRLTGNPEIRYTQGENSICVARYTLAVDRIGREKEADFIRCVAFGRAGEFAERYLTKGMKIAATGRITTGSYTKQDGTKVYTTDVYVDQHEFVEKREQPQREQPAYQETYNAQQAYGEQVSLGDGWQSIPDNIDDGGLPWN